MGKREAWAEFCRFLGGANRLLKLSQEYIMRAKLSQNTNQVADKHHMPSLTMLFARAAGVVPDLELWPELGDALLHGPLTPISFRLDGRDSLIDASSLVLEAAYRVPSWQGIHRGV